MENRFNGLGSEAFVILPGREAAKYLERYVKINPAGVDVAPKKIFKLPDATVFIHGDKRGFLVDNKFLPLKEALQEVKPEDDFWSLEPGRYYVVFPRVKIPEDVVAFAYPRSTFNRLGIIKSQTAVFDPGYEGEWNQTFLFPVPARIHTSEAWVHLVFIKGAHYGKYEGHWQGERY